MTVCGILKKERIISHTTVNVTIPTMLAQEFHKNVLLPLVDALHPFSLGSSFSQHGKNGFVEFIQSYLLISYHLNYKNIEINKFSIFFL